MRNREKKQGNVQDVREKIIVIELLNIKNFIMKEIVINDFLV